MAVRVGDGPGWSRRALLAVAGAAMAASAAGCSWLAGDPPDPLEPDPLEPLLAGTRELAARYERVLATHPGLAGRLRPLHRAHRAHEAALLAAIGRPELASPAAGSPAGSAAWNPPLADRSVPAEPAGALGQLRDAEQAGQQAATRACLSARPERAALLGSITAARACHAEALDG